MRSANWIEARLWEIRNVVRSLANSSMALRIRSLVLDIDGAGGLVEDQDGGVAEHGAGQRDALPLAAGESVAALADDRVVAVRQTP